MRYSPFLFACCVCSDCLRRLDWSHVPRALPHKLCESFAKSHDHQTIKRTNRALWATDLLPHDHPRLAWSSRGKKNKNTTNGHSSSTLSFKIVIGEAEALNITACFVCGGKKKTEKSQFFFFLRSTHEAQAQPYNISEHTRWRSPRKETLFSTQKRLFCIPRALYIRKKTFCICIFCAFLFILCAELPPLDS